MRMTRTWAIAVSSVGIFGAGLGWWRAEHVAPGITRSVFALAAAPSPTFNPNWNVKNWVIDYGNVTGCASDGNDCQHTTCVGSGQGPCATTAQLIATRWGCLGSPKGCPRLPATVTAITWLSTDPESIVLLPVIEPGGGLVLSAPLPTVSYTGTVTSVTTRTRNSLTSGRVVITDMGAVPGNYPAGAFMKINNGGGSMWVNSQPTGTTVDPTQPLTTVGLVPTSVVSPSEALITAAATPSVYNSFVGVNLVDVEAITAAGGDAGNSQVSQIFAYHINGLDPNGLGADAMRWGNGFIAYESRIDRVIDITDNASNLDSGCINCWLSGGIIGARSSGALFRFNGGTLASTATQCNPSGGGLVFDGDFWFDASCTLPNGGALGFVNLADANVTLALKGDTYLLPIATGYGGDEIYGPGTFVVQGSGRLAYDPQDGGADAARNQMNTGGQILLNGQSTGCCRLGTQIACGQPLSAPSFDGVCSDAGNFCGPNCTSDLGAAATVSRNLP